MKRVARTMKRGMSCFIAVLMYSYSFEAISKSCSSCDARVTINMYPITYVYGQACLEQVLLIAKRLLFLVTKLRQRVVKPIIICQLHERPSSTISSVEYSHE